MAFIDFNQARHRAAEAKPDAELRAILDRADFDAVEVVLLDRLEKPSANVDFFLALIIALARRKSSEQLEVFLPLVLESLVNSGDSAAQESFCSSLLTVLPGCAPIRARIIELFRAHYADSPGVDALLKHFMAAESDDIMATMKQIGQWLTFDTGTMVYGPAFGVGRICDVNPTLGTVKAQFEAQKDKPVSFRIGEAHKLLIPLTRGHFLRDVLERPDELRALAKKDSGELLRRLFASVPGPMALAELKAMLAGCISESEWSAWWSKARKNNRLTVGSGARPQVSWSDSAQAADDAILGDFTKAAAREKIDIAIKRAGRSPELTDRFAKGLNADAQAEAQKNPALALELYLAVERIDTNAGDSSAIGALLERGDVVDVIKGVQDRIARRRAVALLRERSAAWPEHYLALLAVEPDGQILPILYDALRESPQREAADRLCGSVLNEPQRASALYLWLWRELAGRDELAARAGWPILQALLAALANDDLKALHAALRKVFDPGEAVDAAVKVMSDEQARQFLAQLDRGVNLEEYRRDATRKYVLECHPDASTVKKEVLFTTAIALEAKREEFTKLISVDIPQNTKEIERAKAHGDLRENFEYHAARARQEMLSSRAKTLHDHLTIARVIDPATVDSSNIQAGTRVLFDVADGSQMTLTILGPWDSDPNNHVVAYLAPAVAAMLGKRVGDQVEYDGRSMRVREISVWQ